MWPAEAHFGRRRLLTATAALAPIAARAQDTGDWPNRPVRLVVPFPPGGPTDIIARLYAQALGPVLKQTVLVENRAGGSGVTGTDYVLKSAADGYTFGIIDGGSLTILPHTQPKMPYRVPEDVTPISRRHPRAGGAGGASEPRREELAGAAGAGEAPARQAEHRHRGRGGDQPPDRALVFRAQTGAAVEVVPYRGAAPAVTDLVAGQVQLLFADLPPLLPHIKAGSHDHPGARRAAAQPDAAGCADHRRVRLSEAAGGELVLRRRAAWPARAGRGAVLGRVEGSEPSAWSEERARRAGCRGGLDLARKRCSP